MKYLALVLAFLASTTWAAPVVVASQSTATSGTSHVVSIPAGLIGERIYVVIVGDYSQLVIPSFSAPRGVGGYGVTLGGAACNHPAAAFNRLSDGTESSVTITSSVPVTAVAWVIRVSGMVVPVGSAVASACHGQPVSYSDPSNINYPLFPGSTSQDTLWVAMTQYNGSAPLSPPPGYGGTLSAQNTVNLSLAFYNSVSLVENPGQFILPASAQSTALVFGIR